MKDYLPESDAKLLAWTANFCAVAQANLTTLGLHADDLNGLSLPSASLDANLKAVNALKAQIEAQYTDKGDNKSLITASARALVRRVQANTNVPNSLKTQLGVPLPNPVRTRTPPATPVSLLATPHANGVNALKWQPGGNKAATQYAILAKPVTGPAAADDDTGWTMIGLTTRRDFRHVGVTPGQPMAYRVLAARAGASSTPSLPATVYTT